MVAPADDAAGSMMTVLLTVPLCAFSIRQPRGRRGGQVWWRWMLELHGVVGAARLECGEPAAEAGWLIGRQLGNSFRDFFDFHVTQYSTARAWLATQRFTPTARDLSDRCCRQPRRFRKRPSLAHVATTAQNGGRTHGLDNASAS